MSVKQYDSTNKILKLIAGGTLWADCPLGTINAYGGAAAPDGWLLCQGQAVSRATYKDLFGIIGTNYGAGDGSTTFNLPDLREATVKGAGLTGKSSNHMDADGLALGEFIDDRVQTHYHYDKVAGSVAAGGNGVAGTSATSPLYSVSVGREANTGRNGATTEVKAVGVNFIIKAIQTPMPADLKAALEEALNDKNLLTWA